MDFKPFLNKLLSKRLFFVHNEGVFKVADGGFVKSDWHEFNKVRLPVVIVGRECTVESTKEYPIPDLKDVKAVVANEPDAKDAMLSYKKTLAGHFAVNLWQLNDEIKSKLKQKICLWIPESLLFGNLESNKVWSFNRLGSVITAVKQNNLVMSSPRSSLFSDSNTFLLSVGATHFEQIEPDENQYLDLLRDGLAKLGSNDLLGILKVQNLPEKILKAQDWRFAITGFMAGIVLMHAVQFAWLNWQNSALEQQAQSQPISQFAQQKKQILAKRKVFERFASQEQGSSLETQLWLFLGLVMDEGIQIAKVRINDGEVWVRFEYNAATDAIAFIKSLPLVKSATLENRIQNVRGKQRFNMVIRFQNNEPGAESTEVSE